MFSCYAFGLMFKQYGRYREAYKICKLSYELTQTLKYTKVGSIGYLECKVAGKGYRN